MKTTLCGLVLILICSSFACAGQVTLEASDMPIKDVMAQIEKQAEITIALDPKIDATVTITLSGAEVSQALDVITKLNKLPWKKLKFARQKDTPIKLDQLKSAMLSMTSLTMIGLSVEDPSSKTTTVYAKDCPSEPDTAKLPLPEGYTWSTVYVILSPEPTVAEKKKDPVAEISKSLAQNIADMAKLTPEQRQQIYASQMDALMTMDSETRQSMMADQMRAVFSMDSQYGSQYMQDFHSVMRSLRDSGEMPDFRGPGGGPRGGPGDN